MFPFHPLNVTKRKKKKKAVEFRRVTTYLPEIIREWFTEVKAQALVSAWVYTCPPLCDWLGA